MVEPRKPKKQLRGELDWVVMKALEKIATAVMSLSVRSRRTCSDTSVRMRWKLARRLPAIACGSMFAGIGGSSYR